MILLVLIVISWSKNLFHFVVVVVVKLCIFLTVLGLSCDIQALQSWRMGLVAL